MEGVRWVAAVCARIGERTDDLEELHDRPRPAVGDQERQGGRLRRAHVQEVQVLPVDSGGELRERVQPGLVLTPVVGGAPVLGQLSQVGERHPVVPADAGELLGPAGPAQALAKVV